jgi:hypothetical protein
MLRLLVEVLAVTLIQSLTLFGLLMQHLPSIIRALFEALRVFMAVSCVVYRGLANWIRPVIARIGVDINDQPWRSLFAALMSVGIGAAACAAAGLLVTAWVIAALSIHGLAVGFVWNQLALPDGQSIGR